MQSLTAVRAFLRVRSVAPAVAAARKFHYSASYMAEHKIIYTITDEAPQLATYALLPIFNRLLNPLGIEVDTSDISLAGRILAQFPDRLGDGQGVDDELAKLGDLCLEPEANVIKLPNISASIPQLNEAIKELQDKGYDIPDYPQYPKTPEEQDAADRYAKALGSAVNPVLRQGNSDRRVAPVVKQFAQKHPHKLKPWPEGSKTHVAHMEKGDFFESEKSASMPAATDVKIVFESASGDSTVMKDAFALKEGEVIDAARMNKAALCDFFEDQFSNTEDGVIVSLHLKATMMKISDPIIFGHAVKVFFKDAFAKHGDTLEAISANPNNGLADVLAQIDTIEDADKKAEILADFEACYASRPPLAMVDSSKGITNLHVPNDVIIDASMPPMIRDGGMMWNKDDALQDTKALIPDRSYAGIYKAMVEDCKENGQFDVATMGNVANVGLMAQKAEEYGSHDKTFEAPSAGVFKVINAADGSEIITIDVGEGDIFRMSQTKDAAIKDWVKLAVNRARETGSPAIFWLNKDRAHDNILIEKATEYLKDHDTSGLDISIHPPAEAMKISCSRCREGKDTISVTGNVLRDYLTDLFPILELGTSAKMLSIVPLLNGGALLETGAGGSAPKHVQQFNKEGHLRWDSLGEYLAMVVSLEHFSKCTGNTNAQLAADTLQSAIGKVLENQKSPSRKVNEPDNRTTSFYIGMYWAQALSDSMPEYKSLADNLVANEAQICQDLIDCQGDACDVGGYYKPDDVIADAKMRPSATLNALIDSR